MKNKDKVKYIFLVIFISLIAVITICGVVIFSKLKGEETPTKVTTDLYELPYNATEYQETIYEELANVCNSIDVTVDDLSEMASLVGKSFVADYFTWSNKRGSYDVGGLDYFFGPSHINFAQFTRNYYYYDLDVLMNTYGVEKLPSVVNIEITNVTKEDDDWEFEEEIYNYETLETEYTTYNYPLYTMVATWTYQTIEGSTYDYSNLPTTAHIYVCLRNDRLEVVHLYEKW